MSLLKEHVFLFKRSPVKTFINFRKVILFSVVTIASVVAFAKPMAQRLGVGIKDNMSSSVPSMAGLYNVNDDFSILGGFGLDTKKDYSLFQVNVGVRHIIFHESNLHFYASGQLGLLNTENPTDGKQNGIDGRFVLGTEFFFAALDNIGFSFEGGFGISTLKETRVRTIADGPLKAGILFYF